MSTEGLGNKAFKMEGKTASNRTILELKQDLSYMDKAKQKLVNYFCEKLMKYNCEKLMKLNLLFTND